MLAFFPSLYPDELLYSGIARYHVRSGNRSLKDTTEDLFGSPSVCATVDLPSHLEKLANNLAGEYDVTSLIEKHTLLPYYLPFISEDQASRALDVMASGAPVGMVHGIIGLFATGVKKPGKLIFCSQCYIADSEKYGEPYWHRVHQLPGVETCLKHGCLLTESKIPFTTSDHKQGYVTLAAINVEDIVIPDILDVSLGEISGFIAEQSMKLLASPMRTTGQDRIRESYLVKLKAKGLATHAGNIRFRQLVSQFSQFYIDAKPLLDKCGKPDLWLYNLLRKPRGSCHPLRHLLLLRFLNGDVMSYAEASHFEPFGQGPWPCLNKATTHFREDVVLHCHISRCSKTKQPVGTFQCSCGFIYSRRGPDQSLDDRYKIGRVKEFGRSWIERLNELVASEGFSFKEIAEMMGVTVDTVRKYKDADFVSTSCSNQCFSENKTIPNELQKRRDRMLHTISNFSKQGTKFIQQMNPKDFTWLYRHDREWLIDKLPQGRVFTDVPTRVDWDARDKEVLHEVKAAIQMLGEQPKPVRITAAAIARGTNYRTLIDKKLSKLPRTRAEIEKNVESIEQYQLRRLEWAAYALLDKEGEIKGWKLLKKAGIPSNITNRVHEKISEILRGRDELCNY